MKFLTILIAFSLAVISSSHADYMIVPKPGQGSGLGQFGPYPNKQAALAYFNANCVGSDGLTYYQIVGSDTSSSAPTTPNSNLTLQQQLGGLAAQQAAINMHASPVGAAFGVGLVEGLLAPQSPQQQAEEQAQQQAALAAQQEQQQREAAAQQLNNNGIYLFKQRDYAGALNEFLQALIQTPNDQVIAKNIEAAKQGLKRTAVAAKNSYALSQLLGTEPAILGTSPSASPLNLVNLDSDPNVVDLRGTTKTYVDSKLVTGASDSQQADLEQTVNELNVLLNNNTVQVKKQLNQLFGQNQNADATKAFDQGGPENTQAQTTDIGGTTGIKGLPGIALNDSTDNGGNNPYGISLLPSTYVNGPGQGSALTQSGSPGTDIALQPAQMTTATAMPDTEKSLQSASQITESASATTQPPNSHFPDNINGNPDFNVNAGDKGPINGNGGSSVVAASERGDEQSAQQAANMSGVTSVGAGLPPAQKTPDQGGPDTKASDQLLSAAASGQNSGHNFDSGGRNAGLLNTASGGGTGYSDETVVDLRGKQGIVDPSSPSFSNPSSPTIAYSAPISRGLDSPSPAVNSPLTAEQLKNKAVIAQGILDAMNAAGKSYETNEKNSPNGYVVIQRFTLLSNGTDATLYGELVNGKTNQLILAFRGTTQKIGWSDYDFNDWTYGNLPNALPSTWQIFLSPVPFTTELGLFGTMVAQKNAGGKSQAYVSAVLIARIVQQKFPNIPVTITGHSLGGGEAALASVATGLPAITFNAAGVQPTDYGYSPTAPTSQITNYHVMGEPLTVLQNNLRTIYGARLMPTAIGIQISILPQTSPLLNTFNHGMGAVTPSMLYFLSQQQ